MDGCHQYTCQRQAVEILDEIQHEHWQDAGPPMGKNLSIADIGRYDDAAGKVGAHFNQPVEIFQRPGSDYNSLSSIAEKLVDRITAFDSAANLYLDIGCGQDCLNLGGVVSTSRYRIEVNEVEMTESVLSPGDGNPNRIGDPDDFLIIRAGGELDARASAQVKRGNCDHCGRFPVRARIMRGGKCCNNCVSASL
jgi:hypothetical protein